MLPIKLKLIKDQVDHTINLKYYKLGKHIKIFNDALKSEELKLTDTLNVENNNI